MQTHNLIPRTKNRKTMLVGRGGKRGKTSGRGTKGQNARSGHKKYPEIRDMIKKLPKLRGYAFNSFAQKPAIVNLGAIEGAFKAGEKVTPATLIEKNLVKLIESKTPAIKILSQGDITKKLSFEGLLFSAGAKEKIEKAGGSIVAKIVLSVERAEKKAVAKATKKAVKKASKPAKAAKVEKTEAPKAEKSAEKKAEKKEKAPKAEKKTK
ncbi:MAG: 50S ribosomal protein L15 [bacterium]